MGSGGEGKAGLLVGARGFGSGVQRHGMAVVRVVMIPYKAFFHYLQ